MGSRRVRLIERRKMLGFTQETFAEANGVDPSTVVRWETGRAAPHPAQRPRMATLLQVTPEGLVDLLTDAPHAVVAQPPSLLPDGDDVKRRTMLTIGLGMGAAALMPTTRAAAAPAVDDPVSRALFRLPDVPAPSRADLDASAAQARHLLHEAQYARLGEMLPILIAGARAAEADDVAARAYVLLAQLAIKNYHPSYAPVAATYARIHAERTGDPVVMGEAAHSMAITMRRAGEYRDAIDHLSSAAANLDAQPDRLAMRGSMLLTAAYAAAQAGWRSEALDLMAAAEDTAARRESAGRMLYLPGVFGHEQVAGYRISVHQALGETTEAIRYGSLVDLRSLPNAERRGRMCMDMARVWRDAKEPERCFAALRALEGHAPEEAQRPKVRAITADLLTTGRELPGLREFAQRTGAAA